MGSVIMMQLCQVLLEYARMAGRSGDLLLADSSERTLLKDAHLAARSSGIPARRGSPDEHLWQIVLSCIEELER